MDGNNLHHLPPAVGLAAFGEEKGRYWPVGEDLYKVFFCDVELGRRGN